MAPRRIKLTLEYDGDPFHGFQRQEGLLTVQGELERAIQEISGQAVTLQVAGRTDKGVHALGQVCHFDIDSPQRLLVFKDGINRLTPPAISVIRAEEVASSFQARFDCIARQYRYLIFNRREPSPFWADRAAHGRRRLDVDAMREGAAHLIGRHDFSSFRSAECQAKTPVTALHHILLKREGDLITVDIRGAAFLHNMVRIVCGTLVLVGLSRLSPGGVKEILDARDRRRATLTLPAHGLCFMAAEYHPHEILESC